MPIRTGNFAARLYIWLATFLAVGLLSIILGQLVEDRGKTRAAAVASASNVGNALATDIAGSIATLERMLLGVRGAIAAGDQRLARERLDMLLLAMPDAVKLSGATDAGGHIVLGNAGSDYEQQSLNWRPYFIRHQANPDRGLYISGPYAALSDGTPMIVASLRLDDAQGQFAGVLVAGIQLSYFNKLFDRIAVESGGSMTLFTDKGVVIGRRPYDPQVIGRDLSKFPGVKRALAGERTFEDVAAIDNVERLYVSTPIGGYPLFINVAQSTDTIFAHWTAKTITIGFTTALLVGGMILLVCLFYCENGRRGEVQMQLAEANRQLHQAAETDALTGIANRRRVERLLAQYGKAGSKDFSVLMLDIDLFKHFNDQYGHEAGDKALHQVAQTLADSLPGDHDLVARYGGEEFIILLPGSSIGNAQTVAEHLRARVAALQIPHATSPFHNVTVSIGLAGTGNLNDLPPEELVRLADKALYRSKQAGRNRVTTSPFVQPKANDSNSAREVA